MFVSLLSIACHCMFNQALLASKQWHTIVSNTAS